MNQKNGDNQSNLHNSISLRRFPYPYKAAISICSDIDLCTRKAFILIHRFLNSSKHGLGLPVADSFFGSSMGNPQLGYLDPFTFKPGSDAPFIRDALKAGLIDSIHGWGDFNDTPPDESTIQSIASTLTEDLASHNLKVPIWINHGLPLNTQNIYCRLYSKQCYGDIPESGFYTVNHFPKLGIRYIWMTENVTWPLSVHNNYLRLTRLTRMISNYIKNKNKLLKNRDTLIKPWAWLEELCVPFPLRDGNTYTGFSRCNPDKGGAWYRPKRSTIHRQLNFNFLNQLELSQGYAILYTHLGYPVMTQGEIPFTRADLSSLENLAQKYNDGKLWVAPTVRILDYWKLVNGITWKTVETHQGIDIEINPNGGNIPRSGLTFYTQHPSRTRIVENGKLLNTVNFPPDFTGVASIGIPVAKAPCTDLLE